MCEPTHLLIENPSPVNGLPWRRIIGTFQMKASDVPSALQTLAVELDMRPRDLTSLTVRLPKRQTPNSVKLRRALDRMEKVFYRMLRLEDVDAADELPVFLDHYRRCRHAGVNLPVNTCRRIDTFIAQNRLGEGDDEGDIPAVAGRIRWQPSDC